jgi:hypothetical protein
MHALLLIAVLPTIPAAGQEGAMSANLVANADLSKGVYGPSHWGLNRSGERRVDWYGAADGAEFALRLQGSASAGGRSSSAACRAGTSPPPRERIANCGRWSNGSCERRAAATSRSRT